MFVQISKLHKVGILLCIFYHKRCIFPNYEKTHLEFRVVSEKTKKTKIGNTLKKTHGLKQERAMLVSTQKPLFNKRWLFHAVRGSQRLCNINWSRLLK